ncbi:unnamed protein product [Cuscuta campestris]|uniref:Uncharacterized protein n=1 Tax=Cuscuta campestris TaxID=132261 RepID=A0A484N4T7_9ASTE|nr:unnamed protein product [Cuscuta campestris]
MRCSAWGDRRAAPGPGRTQHQACCHFPAQEEEDSKERSGKVPMIEEVLEEGILEGEDDESSECRVSAFKRMGGDETHVSTFDRLNLGHDGRQALNGSDYLFQPLNGSDV